MTDPSPTNGRATVARLDTKLDNVTALLEENKDEHKEFRGVLVEISTANAVNEERWKNHRDEHTRENRVITAISSGLGAISGFISGVLSH